MCQSMVDIQSAAAEIRRGKKKEKIYMVSLLHRATIKNKSHDKEMQNQVILCMVIFAYVSFVVTYVRYNQSSLMSLYSLRIT